MRCPLERADLVRPALEGVYFPPPTPTLHFLPLTSYPSLPTPLFLPLTAYSSLRLSKDLAPLEGASYDCMHPFESVRELGAGEGTRPSIMHSLTQHNVSTRKGSNPRTNCLLATFLPPAESTC